MATPPSDEAIERFVRIRRDRPAWPGVPDGLRPSSIEDGYALQAAVHERLAASGDRRAGYKIGATTPRGQQRFGISQPVYAGIFDGTRSASLAEGLSRPLVAPAVEIEMALVLARSIDPNAPGDPLDAVASYQLSCEIIDERYGDNPLAAGVPSLLADDFFNAGFVLGPANPSWRRLDLRRLPATVTRDGEAFAGNTADVLPAPDSLAWLVRSLASRGRRLEAGDIVLTGSIIPPIPVRMPLEVLSLEVEGFVPLTL